PPSLAAPDPLRGGPERLRTVSGRTPAAAAHAAAQAPAGGRKGHQPMRTLLAVLAAAAGLTACTPAPAEPVPDGRAPLTAPASPCARAAELTGPAAELARSRMRQLAATPAGPVEPESVRLLADDMLRATMRVRKIVDSS